MLVAAVVAVAILVATVWIAVALLYERSESRESQQSSGTSVEGNVAGNCNINGINNRLQCGMGPSMKNVAVRDRGDILGLYFKGPPETLPTPPANLAGSTCRDEALVQWFRATPGFYFGDIEKIVELTAGDPDLVAITDASTIIVSREQVQPDQITSITCYWGGGGLVGNYDIDIDTESGKATLTEIIDEEQLGTPKGLPPASVSLGTKSAAVVGLSATSNPNFAYEAIVTLTVSMNGETRPLDIGDKKVALRWIETPGTQTVQDYYAITDQGTWQRNWAPF